MPKQNTFVSFLIGCLLSASAFAGPSCPIPYVSLSSNSSPPDVNASESAITITRLRGNRFFPQASMVLGLFSPNATVGISSTLSIRRDDSKTGAYGCISNVEIKVSMAPVILIAKEIPQGSCAWREVHQHEMKHHNSQLLAADLAREQVARQVGAILSFPVLGSTPAEMTSNSEMPRRNAMSAAETIIQAAAQGVHDGIDSEQEYQRVALSCGGEIQRILRGMWSTHVTR